MPDPVLVLPALYAARTVNGHLTTITPSRDTANFLCDKTVGKLKLVRLHTPPVPQVALLLLLIETWQAEGALSIDQHADIRDLIKEIRNVKP